MLVEIISTNTNNIINRVIKFILKPSVRYDSINSISIDSSFNELLNIANKYIKILSKLSDKAYIDNAVYGRNDEYTHISIGLGTTDNINKVKDKLSKYYYTSNEVDTIYRINDSVKVCIAGTHLVIKDTKSNSNLSKLYVDIENYLKNKSIVVYFQLCPTNYESFHDNLVIYAIMNRSFMYAVFDFREKSIKIYKQLINLGIHRLYKYEPLVELTDQSLTIKQVLDKLRVLS